MESELLGIGRMASLSGLSVSALRFYDAAGVLTPAATDPASGYRRYRPDQVRTARLIARLRRAGLGVPAIRDAVRSPDAAGPILDGHLVQLELQLDEARRQLSIARSLLTMEDPPVLTLHTTAADLRAGLLDVRFAVSEDPELPMLTAVLFDVTADRLRLVATDRYRMALASLAVTVVSGEPAELLLPVELVDRLIAGLADRTGEVTVSRTADGVRFTVAGTVISGSELSLDFPNYRPWPARSGSRSVPVDVPALRAALATAPAATRVRESDGASYPLSVLAVTPAGLRVVPDSDGSAPGLIGVNREFLLQALEAGRGDQLTMELDGPAEPLTFRNPDRTDSLSLLMPVRLD
ncbi:MAG TPA: MerR family transcriptional regulator [Jatrophihabitans sp.]|nr:MerR family transcriptional regulator [Jatrophihabitans sp.]